MPPQDFQWDDFFDTFGNTIQSGVGNVGSTFDANAQNSQAIANLNNAQAAATLKRAQNQAELQKGLIMIAIFAVIGIVLVSIIKIIAPKLFK